MCLKHVAPLQQKFLGLVSLGLESSQSLKAMALIKTLLTTQLILSRNA